MNRTVIEVPVLSDALRRIGAPVSVLVRAGDMLYTCGMPPLDIRTGDIVTGDITVQTRAALTALDFALHYAGSSLAQAVKATVYIADNAMTAEMNAVYRGFFPSGFPVRTCLEVPRWPHFDIEIECVVPVP